MSDRSEDPEDGPRALQKARRAAADKKSAEIDIAVKDIEKQVQNLIRSAAARLEVPAEKIQTCFLQYVNTRGAAKPIAWNGLVHEKAKEWGAMKNEWTGGSFIQYVVERIKEEGLYENLSDEDRLYYSELAMEARDSKINAGVAKTSLERMSQGSVKDELNRIGTRLAQLHQLTSIECMFLVARGNVGDGLRPVYYVTDKAQEFFEWHLNLPISHLVGLMESAALGGGIAAAKLNKTETGLAKTQLRKSLLESLRDAATSTAEDGSLPKVTNRLLVKSVEYKNYWHMVETLRVSLYGWEFDKHGSMVDPSSMGLAKMSSYLQKLRAGECGFKRLTDEEWNTWKKKLEADVAAGSVVISIRKTRSDAGIKRKEKDMPVDLGPQIAELSKPKAKKTKPQTANSSQPTEDPAGPISPVPTTSDSPVLQMEAHEGELGPHFQEFAAHETDPAFSNSSLPSSSASRESIDPFPIDPALLNATIPATRPSSPSSTREPAHTSHPRPVKFQFRSTTPESWLERSLRPKRARSQTPTSK